ncbi:MAG: DUF3576 domain-containing protein [Alphaproteobacteria bacterium]|nr:DUF3576 domain-containing protein [Alphaproteobacteria bacterium]
MKAARTFFAITLGALALSGCLFGGGKKTEYRAVEDIAGGSNPYLWRASLDTLQDLPLVAADPLGGTIIYDWKSYPEAMNERIKATVYILDSRLRADGVKVSVFRQVNGTEGWEDAVVDPETGIQLENAILARARNLKASELD